jgi:sugar (pentulose or hexulose) kinase
MLLTLGTAHVACLSLPRMPPARASFIRGPYPGGRAYRLVTDNCGGNLVNWAQTVLAGCQGDARFFAQAASARRGCGGLRFEILPDGLTGLWRNLGLHHTPADFARSLVETLSQRMAALARRLTPRPGNLLVAGGGSQSRFFVRTLSEALGARVRVTPATPLLGAARMAAELLAPKRNDDRTAAL